ncbi:MAG: EthD domain-containing protein [Nocardioidaceae bacterium]|nr:EthD domain-containing protein [Nocardioidaceae bacterium]
MTATVKLIHILRGENSVEASLSPDLREHLAQIGVQRLQVNVDDAEVAPAQLRFKADERPIRSVVTTWTHGDPDALTQVLRAIDADVVGWRVEDRVPLNPPNCGDGQRADAYAQVVLLGKPEGRSHAEWLDRWINSHTAVAIETQSTFGYIQNVVVERLTGKGSSVDAVVEELFPMEAMTDWHVFYDTGGDQAELERRMERMKQSVDYFGARSDMEVVPTSRYVFDLSNT